LVQAFDFLGKPLAADLKVAIADAAKKRDAVALQKLIDPHVLFIVSLNPEVRVQVARGTARAEIQQGGFTPTLARWRSQLSAYLCSSFRTKAWANGYRSSGESRESCSSAIHPP
jgi:hypothetical protein